MHNCFYSTVLCDLLKHMPQNKLTKQKMMTVNEIVHSKLFTYPECRQILLPVFTKQIKQLIEQHEEVSVASCVKLNLLISYYFYSQHEPNVLLHNVNMRIRKA